jgi:hypothetical protein
MAEFSLSQIAKTLLDYLCQRLQKYGWIRSIREDGKMAGFSLSRTNGSIFSVRDCGNMAGFSLSETVETWLDSFHHRLRKPGWILSVGDCGNVAGLSL